MYSGDLCDYEIYLSLSVYCLHLTHLSSVSKIDERCIVGLSGARSGSCRKDPLSRRRVREEAVFSDIAGEDLRGSCGGFPGA